MAAIKYFLEKWNDREKYWDDLGGEYNDFDSFREAKLMPMQLMRDAKCYEVGDRERFRIVDCNNETIWEDEVFFREELA